mmetsp:Transcript_33418/g.30419  ORF Transcript_33418/g.30419 Transcript_33418/m.30419 type:complete len:96 (-) Transcript_33418:845-1132(-)
MGDMIDIGDGDNWGVDDIDVPDVEIDTKTENKAGGSEISIADSVPGKDSVFEKGKHSQLAGELVAVGEFEAAMAALKKQIGVVEFDPFMPIFKKV